MMASTDHLSHRLRLAGRSPLAIVARTQAAAAVCLAIGTALLVGALRMPHPGQERAA